MPARRFDAHCHVFNLDYLVLEAANMLWDELRGRYPKEARERLGIQPGRLRPLFDFLRTLAETAFAALGEEGTNVELIQRKATAAWADGAPVCVVPLMMDIYFIFAPPLEEVGTFDVAPFRDGMTDEQARAQFKGKLLEAGLQDRWIETIFEQLDAPPRVASAGVPGLEDTWGFRKHRQALVDLVRRRRGELFPFFAVDPRRKGAIEAVCGGDLVSKSGPFYGVKLYPRLGYHPGNPVMMPLYEWCANNDIPIITHCDPKGFPPWPTDHSDFGNPENFRPILESYPKLRIDFAHFAPADPDWANTIVDLIGRYPGAYSDISCYTPTAEPKAFHDGLWQNSSLHGRVMFGTDFDVMYFTYPDVNLQDYCAKFPPVFSAEDWEQLSRTVPEAFFKVS